MINPYDGEFPAFTVHLQSHALARLRTGQASANCRSPTHPMRLKFRFIHTEDTVALHTPVQITRFNLGSKNRARRQFVQ